MEVLVFPKNEEKALQMEKYMKNLFSFAGVPKPERALLQQPLLDESKNLSISEVLAFVHYYYEQIEKRVSVCSDRFSPEKHQTAYI